MIHLVALLLTLSSSFAFADAWDDVLHQGSLEKSQLKFNDLDLAQSGGADFQAPIYLMLHGEPLRIPYFADSYRDILLDYAKEPFKVSVSTMARMNLGIRRNLEGDPLAGIAKMAKEKDALVRALDHLHRLAKKPLSAAQKSTLGAKASKLSPDAREQISYLIESIAHSLEWRARGLADVDPRTLAQVAAEISKLPMTDQDEDRDGLSTPMKRLLKTIDMPVLMSGGFDLLLAVQNSREKLTKLKPSDQFQWSTPFGEILVRGDKSDNVYKADKFPLLIIDGGGNDTYYAGGGADLDHPVGILIDLEGNDRYLASPGLENVFQSKERRDPKLRPLFGAGVFGYGILVDGGGDDVYRAYRVAEGSSAFGLGVLWDLGGNDHYECWVQCQGSAQFGSGVLIDGGGKDSYKAMSQSQGFAGPLAAGVLVDAGTDADTYEAVSSPVDFPSQVDQKFNVSFSQGASYGVRADGRDGHGLAGGFAALIDGGGDNTFDAGFFAQGVAYWYGVGWLSSGDGNDRYKAGKYAQGAGVHFAVGILQDTGGNDSYEVEQELGMGHGHDFAVGFLIDEKGDDTYRAPNFSLGCASAEGIGVFWDKSGNDTYETSAKETLGCASLRIETPSLRVMARTTGVFLDTGGKNTFKAPAAGLEGSISSRKWVRPSIEIPKAPKRMQDLLIGLGLVVDKPDTSDPF